MPTTYNVNIAGNLTNNNGILSGFSGSNYASFARPTFNNTFEIGAKVTTGNNVSDLQIVYCPDTDQHGVRFEISGGKFGLLAGANGAWINTSSYTGGSVSANTPYFLKASYNGSTYKLEVSTDNVNYSTVVSYNSSTKVTNGFTNYLLGTFLDHNLGIFGGTIDLNYCYIKIDDNLVWEGATILASTPKIGTNDIQKAYLGSQEINKIYLGSEVVYEASGSGQIEQLLPIPQMTSNSQGGFTVIANHYDRQWGSYEYTLFSPVSSGWYAGNTLPKPDTIYITFPSSHYISKIVLKQNNNSNSIAHNGRVEITTDGRTYSTLTNFTMDTALESLTTVNINADCLGYRLVFTDNASTQYPNNGVALLAVTTYEIV